MSMTVPDDGGSSKGDLEPEVLTGAVSSGSSRSLSLIMHDVSGLTSPVSAGTVKPAFEPVDLSGADLSGLLFRKYDLSSPAADFHSRLN